MSNKNKPVKKPIKRTTPTEENTLTTKQYSKLISDIKNLIEVGIDKSSKDNISRLTTTYWQIGQRIAAESLSTKSGYHNSILRGLSNELELERSTLSRCFNFFKTYKSAPDNTVLSWSHYRELLTIKDDKLRNELEQKAKKENWSKERLIAAIRQSQNQNPNSKTKIERPTEPTYLYRAKVLEILDGDTMIVSIDLGFQVWKEQRIRLASLNAPEIYTEKGKKAYQFLLSKLGKIDQVLIKTRKLDIYGRYVGHIFYDPNPTQNKLSSDEIFKKGNYLNQEIVGMGLAEVV